MRRAGLSLVEYVLLLAIVVVLAWGVWEAFARR